MDGHGVYVWSVYIVGLIVLVLLGLTPLVRLRNLMKRLRREHAPVNQD